MGAKAGRKGARSYNLLTCGVGAWRKYLDKTRRKSAKRAAIAEQEMDRPCVEHSDPTCRCDDPDYARTMHDNDLDPECICGLIVPNSETCQCGCRHCCPEERGG
jgi:hypothetical protein